MSVFAPASRKITIRLLFWGDWDQSLLCPCFLCPPALPAQTGPPAQGKWTWLLGEDCLGREGGCFVWGSFQRPWN